MAANRLGVKTTLISLCLSLCLIQAAWAQPAPTIQKMEWSETEVKDGYRITGRVILTAPAPPGGVSIIFEPTFKLSMPTVVKIPEGLDYVDFPVKIIDNRFQNTDKVGTTVTAVIHGQIWEGNGPVVSQDRARYYFK